MDWMIKNPVADTFLYQCAKRNCLGNQRTKDQLQHNHVNSGGRFFTC